MNRDHRSSKRQTQPPSDVRYAAGNAAPQQQQQYYGQDQRYDNGYGTAHPEPVPGVDMTAIRRLYNVLDTRLPPEYEDRRERVGKYPVEQPKQMPHANERAVRELYNVLDKPYPPDQARYSERSSSSRPQGYERSAHVPAPRPDPDPRYEDAAQEQRRRQEQSRGYGYDVAQAHVPSASELERDRVRQLHAILGTKVPPEYGQPSTQRDRARNDDSYGLSDSMNNLSLSQHGHPNRSRDPNVGVPRRESPRGGKQDRASSGAVSRPRRAF